YFFFSSRRRHTRSKRDWSSDVCSSDLSKIKEGNAERNKGSFLLIFCRKMTSQREIGIKAWQQPLHRQKTSFFAQVLICVLVLLSYQHVLLVSLSSYMPSYLILYFYSLYYL